MSEKLNSDFGIFQISGKLELSLPDQEEQQCTYGEVNLIVTGHSHQIDELVSRLNTAYHGRVTAISMSLSMPKPKGRNPAYLLPPLAAMREDNEPRVDMAGFGNGDYVEWREDGKRCGGHARGLTKDGKRLVVRRNSDGQIIELAKDELVNFVYSK